jgi:hypothetical protein
MSNPRKYEQESVVLIYDPDSGRILHEHHFVTSDGGEHPDERAREELALAEAARAGHDVAKLAALHPDRRDLREGVRYAVDGGSRSLVEVAAAA